MHTILKQLKNKIIVSCQPNEGGPQDDTKIIISITGREIFFFTSRIFFAPSILTPPLPPFYYNFTNEEIFNYYSDIAKSSDLPIIIYNIERANLMDIDTLKKLAAIENIKGVKYTAATHFNFEVIKKEIGNYFKIYNGMDQMAISGLISGADGLIGSFYNLMPEIFVQIFENIKTGNIAEAKKLQIKANVIILYAVKKSGYSFIKMGLNWMGIDSGYVRKPFTSFVDKDIEKEIKKDLKVLCSEYDLSGIKFLETL